MATTGRRRDKMYPQMLELMQVLVTHCPCGPCKMPLGALIRVSKTVSSAVLGLRRTFSVHVGVKHCMPDSWLIRQMNQVPLVELQVNVHVQSGKKRVLRVRFGGGFKMGQIIKPCHLTHD